MDEIHRRYHEVANIFPLMQGADYEALKADIAENGVLVPVEVDEFFARNHMLHSEQGAVEVKAFCKQRGLHPFIQGELQNSTFFAVWWGYADLTTKEMVTHPGWEHYAKVCTPTQPCEVPTQYVYFIQAVNGGPIKIGIAYSPEERLAQIQNMSPVQLRILGVRRGGAQHEAELHKLFAASRLHGEWFEPSAELTRFIADNAKKVTP